jgi:TonB family protein
VQLITPVQPPETEPEPPAPAEPQKAVIKQPTAVKVPTRQVNMARLDESPREAPSKVSTVKNTQKERPANRYFEIGKIDSDPVVPNSSGRTSSDAATGGSGTGLTATAKAPAFEKEAAPPPPPPPPVKKAPPKAPVIRSMGVINGKATSLPKPAYPAAARAVQADGQVSVHVLIDESGHVVSANATSGHPLLRNAAEAAARNARFTPTQLSGVPIKVSGTIIYNFRG